MSASTPHQNTAEYVEKYLHLPCVAAQKRLCKKIIFFQFVEYS